MNDPDSGHPDQDQFLDEKETEERTEAEVLYALQHRPRLSIRSRLLFGFMLLVLLSLGEDIVNLLSLRSVGNKLDFLLTAERFTTEIQQARRFEKNFFLYGSNLEDAIHHAQVADSLLRAQSDALAQVAGHSRIAQLRNQTHTYESLLKELQIAGITSDEDRDRIEPLLRQYGAEAVNYAFELTRKERESVQRVLHRAEWAPWLFFVVLLALSIYMSIFLGQSIIKRLGQLMNATERIAMGDFNPIPPGRRYKDEISNLTIALNQMMHDLRRHESAMVQSHKLRAVGTLTAGIAHELNNPLNNIMLTTAVLEENYTTLNDADRLEMMQDLTHEAERARKIVRNLLDFARDSGKGVDHFDLNDVLQESVRLLQNQIKLHKLSVTLDPSQQAIPLHGDRQELTQVFVNLIINAIDALQKNGTISITVKRDRNPEFVTVEVRDDGPGIAPHILPTVFDPFFTTKATGKGVGLGLSVSLGIVKRHGGDITVRSTLGHGAAFQVVLPVAETPGEMNDNTSSPE